MSAPAAAGRSFAVPAGAQGERLDVWLAAQSLAPTRSQIKIAAEAGRLTVDGRAVRVSHRLRGGETVVLVEEPVEFASDRVGPQAIALEVLFEDAFVVAVNKPAGMVVHPAVGNRSGTLVNAVLGRYPGAALPGEPTRAGIVHRLDRDTSGVILVARTVAAHESLARQFRERTVKKVYWAVVLGKVAGEGRIDAPIGRHPSDRKRMSTRGRPARSAVTDVRPLESFGGATLIEARPLTGRTHQIRVHLAARGWPILGDSVYGGTRAPAMIGRQALHAASIEFAHPDTGRRLTVSAPLPSDFEALLARLRAGS
ncbi:MAG: RluA family pseudouridine synthase [Deltaproteobacteria bacterium]|nr:RluA family pseudouridine synthase [Deltaproteobacteria bacterium]